MKLKIYFLLKKKIKRRKHIASVNNYYKVHFYSLDLAYRIEWH